MKMILLFLIVPMVVISSDDYAFTTLYSQEMRQESPIMLKDADFDINGGYFACGTTTFSNETRGVLFLRMDVFGNPTLVRQFKIENHPFETRRCIQTSDGGYVIIFNTKSQDGFVMRLNVTGDMKWGKRYAGSSLMGQPRVVDGNLLLAGTMRVGLFANALMFLNITLSTGEKNVAGFYGGTLADNYCLADSYFTETEVVLTGFENRGIQPSNLIIGKFSLKTGKIWAYKFQGLAQQSETGTCITPVKPSGFIIGGLTDIRYGIIFVKFNDDGTVQWKLPYYSNPTDVEALAGITQLADLSIVSIGLMHNGNHVLMTYYRIANATNGEGFSRNIIKYLGFNYGLLSNLRFDPTFNSSVNDDANRQPLLISGGLEIDPPLEYSGLFVVTSLQALGSSICTPVDEMELFTLDYNPTKESLTQGIAVPTFRSEDLNGKMEVEVNGFHITQKSNCYDCTSGEKAGNIESESSKCGPSPTGKTTKGNGRMDPKSVWAAVFISIPFITIGFLGWVILILISLFVYVIITGCCLIILLIICMFCCCCTSSSLVLVGKGRVMGGTKHLKERLLSEDAFNRLVEDEGNQNMARLSINESLFEILYDDLKVLKMIGKGGSNSIVFHCLWKDLECAFKCFKTNELFGTQQDFDEFEKEVSIMSSTRHPNCLSFYGCCLHPPRVGIVMEYCPNGDLKIYLNGKKDFSIRNRIRLLKEISDGMEYLHDRNVIHRDLKSENVLLTQEIVPKVMDFGVSKIVSRKDVAKTKNVGTCVYMAPEVTKGEAYDGKCDVFSFSILMWEILTLNFEPYEGFSVPNIEYKVATQPDFRPSLDKIPINVDSGIVDIMIKCWDDVPSNRPDFGTLRLKFKEFYEVEEIGDDE